jgi:hypothetical protein
MMLIQRLGHETASLTEYYLVNIWKKRGIVPNGILNQNDCLHSNLKDIMIGIHFILNQLYDSHSKSALPNQQNT